MSRTESMLMMAALARIVLSAPGFAAAPVSSAALRQTSPAGPASSPVFRIGTKLVEVDVIVRDKNGPVAGLTQDDFTILDNGRQQRIALFSVRSSQNLGAPAPPLPRGMVSNRFNRNGRASATSTVILLDRLNTPPEGQRYAQARIVKFLEARGNQDKIGVYTLGTSLRVVQDLTDDPERIASAIRNLKPQNANRRTLYAPGPLEHVEPEMSSAVLEEYTLFTATDRVLAVKHALQAVAHHLSQVPGRKNLIWITASFPLLTQTQHVTEDHSPEIQEAARALNDANVAMYAVDARGLVGVGRRWGLTIPGLDTMNRITSLTGGKAYYADNGIEDLIRKATEDSELTYTLGFYPAAESEDGDWHKLKVDVDRKAVDVRYRKGYFVSRAAADAELRSSLDQLIRDPLEAGELGVLAQGAPDLFLPGIYRVRIGIDLRDVQLRREDSRWVGGVNISLYVEGSKTIRTLTRNIEIPDNQLAPALDQRIVIDNAIFSEQPGDLRIIVQDNTTGAAGSVRVPLGRK